MTNSIVIASKVVAEVHIFAANFSPYLSQGEGIVFGSWVVSVSVYSGIDPTPTAILDGFPTISGNIVSQQIQLGVVGVTYRIVTRVTTTLGHVLSLDTYLAVLPNNYPANGVFITLYETSHPYPIYNELPDTLNFLPLVGTSFLDVVLANVNIQDTLHFTPGINTSDLHDLVINLPITDTLHFVPLINTSALDTLIVLVNIQDTLHFNTAVLTSSLNTIVIQSPQQDTLHFVPSINTSTLA